MISAPLAARDVVDASEPTGLAVTIYRDPYGGFDRDNPGGFAMISETRSVTLPAGESTVRFEGVAEGMIAVSAIVSGLPGGTIEKNRNAALLSPAALVDGTLGNRVTITRTNPATGQEESEQAVVRTRADGGIVLQTAQGYEAVRCSGLPEKLTFDTIPDGLSAQPVFSIDTRDETGGTYEVTLTYLSWGFDWQAHYITTLLQGDRRGRQYAKMLSWLTLVNDNAQSFDNAELLVVAGTLNVESDFEELAEPPRGESLRLRCWPRGNTAAGSPSYPYPPAPAPPPAMMADSIVVTGARMQKAAFESASSVAVMAGEENLGDLKLFRVPEPITVRAKGLKQVAFLDKDRVRGELIYEAACDLYSRGYQDDQFGPAQLIFQTENDERHGLGVSLPQGGVTVFEPSRAGDLLIGEDEIRDYPIGQEVEINLAESTKVFHQCARTGEIEQSEKDSADWRQLRAAVTNSGSQSAQVRLEIGRSADIEVRRTRGLKLRNGAHVIETSVGAGEEREFLIWVRDI
uniref:DUF4139 domain-containing protein n=1 Tax=uncultured Altererythrobacter sp. TaxID=500840 RepID=UPI0026056AE1|nr:hypothetical protein [uncultured Altererythrobacter sp.]